MSIISKQDTNGVKPLLLTGELGYDNYPAGGDVGRVFVGTGTENIGLAKKTEVMAVDGKADTHIARVDNPHNVTKAQVGLGNADNTADVDKNVLSATKLTTPRNITISGEVAGSVSFDGSTDINISTTIQPNSVALGTDTTGNYVDSVIAGEGITVTGVVGEGGTPSIAIAPVGTSGTYTKVSTNNKGQVVSGELLTANDIPDLDASKITSGVIDAARLPASAGNIPEYATLSEFPIVGDSGKVYIALDTNKMYRWSGSTYVSIAGGVDSVAGKTGAVSLDKGDVGLANVDNTADASKNVLSATKLATAITINGVSFDGTANITVSDSTAVKKSANLSDLANIATARTNLGLGTAATKNVGTASGNVMEVGAFGVGKVDKVDYPADSLDTVVPSGLYYALASQGFPFTPDGHVLVMSYSNSWAVQIAFDYRTSKTVRRSRDSGSWTAWQDYIHSGNLQTSTGQSTIYPMTQKAVTDALDTTVKLTGNQTIAGVKTFSSTISGSISGNAATATTATNVSGGKATVQGTGNDYNLAGVEVKGDGPANTVFPTIGFHQPALYASSLQLRGANDFRFYAQGGTSYANVTANTFIGNLSGNADTATNAGYATTAGRSHPRRSDGADLNFYWSGQGGQPTWLWGGTDGHNMYVYNPSNFNVNYANSAGSAGSAGYANTLAGDENNWAGYRDRAVANMLSWNNYGNGHIIFDASRGVAPNGAAVNNVNPHIGWGPTFPTLMGWNGANTYGVRVHTASYAETVGSASPTVSGGIKARLDGTTLYITTNGANA